MTTQRPFTVTIAAVLLALFSILSLIPIPDPTGTVPTIVIYSSYVLGALGLVGAVGLWLCKKWGMWLTVIVSAISILAAAPGIVFAPTTTLWLLATLSVVAYAVILVLVLMRQSRRAYA